MIILDLGDHDEHQDEQDVAIDVIAGQSVDRESCREEPQRLHAASGCRQKSVEF